MMKKKDLYGFFISLCLHGLFCVFLLWNGVSLFRKPTEEVPTCSIPLEVMEISEISQAPISMPQEEEPDHQERKREEHPLPDTEKNPITPKEKKEPIKEKEPTPPKEKAQTPKEEEKKEIEEKDPDIEGVLKNIVKKEQSFSKKKQTQKKSPSKKPSPPKKSSKKNNAGQKGQSNKENDEEDFIKMLKNLDHDKKGPSATTPITDKDSTSRYGAAAVGPHMSMSYMDRVRRVLEGAWRVPIRAKENGTLIIVVELEMNPDGSIAHVQVLHGEGTPNHPTYQIGVQNVLEALDSPRCNPLPLPKDRYTEWKKFKFRFMPK